MIDLISRQEAIEAVQYAMRNGGEWRKALETVPARKNKELVILRINQLLSEKDICIETEKLNSRRDEGILIIPAYMDYITTVDGDAEFDFILQEIKKGNAAHGGNGHQGPYRKELY